MILEKFEIILSLFVGLVFTIVGFYFQMPLWDLLVRLLVTMLVFYIIGAIVKNYLLKAVFDKNKVEDDAENADKHEGGSGESNAAE